MTSSASALSTAHSFSHFMENLSQRQRPALLWYSVPGERIELSGRVLDNWVAKTANLLVDECDLEPGQIVVLPSRVHWRSFVLALAALRVGATITFDREQATQVFATFDPAECDEVDAEYVLVLATEPLAPRFNGKLPDGSLDYAAEVRSHPDVYVGLSEPIPQENAWEGTSHRELLERLDHQAKTLNDEIKNNVVALCLRNQTFGLELLEQALTALGAGYAALLLDPEADWPGQRISQVLGDEQAQPYPNSQLVVNRS